MAAKLCLKARPTPSQLADRLRAVDGVWPDGLELYLAAADLATPAVMDDIVDRLQKAEIPPDFALLIEGPVDSLDGGDFGRSCFSFGKRSARMRVRISTHGKKNQAAAATAPRIWLPEMK